MTSCLKNSMLSGLATLTLILMPITSGQDVKTQEIPLSKVRSCGTMPRYNQLLAHDAGFRKLRVEILALTQAYKSVHASARLAPRTTLIRVPVVVHVIYNKDQDNISDDQIRSQIAVLNNDYQNIGQDPSRIPVLFRAVIGNPLLKFELAAFGPDGKPTTGIVRQKSDTTVFYADGPKGDGIKFAKTGGDAPWPADRYLNIWICNSLEQDNQDVLGYSSFPGDPKNRDGVVIVNHAFGTTGTAITPFNKGRTATHEIGHWLNLFHIWGDDEKGPDVCAGSDQVDDTPNQGVQNYGCPGFPHPSCKNDDKGGDMFMNYLDYTDDSCMQMFTMGQVSRIEATLAGYRSGIPQSPGLAH
jgi:hypothetical protein